MDKFKTYFDRNQFREATEYYGKLLNLDHNLRFDIKDRNKLKLFYSWCRFMLLRGLANTAIDVFDKNIPNTRTVIETSPFPRQIANLLDQRANLAFYMGEYKEGEFYINKAIKWKKHNNNKVSREGKGELLKLHQSNIILGKLKWKQGALFEALAAYFEVFKYNIDRNKNPKSHFYNGRIWCLIGQVYLDMGDPEYAFELFKHSDQLLNGKKSLVSHHMYKGVTRINKAKAILLTLRKKANESKTDSSKKAIPAEIICSQIKQAEGILFEVRELFREAINEEKAHRYWGTLLNAFALLERTKLKFNTHFPKASIKKVNDDYEKEWRLRRKTFGFNCKHPTVVIAFNRSAKALLAHYKKVKKLGLLEKAIKLINESHNEVKNLDTEPRSFETYYLKAKANYLLHLTTGSPKSLKIAYTSIEKAIKIGMSIYFSNSFFNIAVIFRQRLRQAYELSLNILFLIWEKDGENALETKMANKILSKMEGSRLIDYYYLGADDKKAPLTLLPGFDKIKETLAKLMQYKVNDLGRLPLIEEKKAKKLIDKISNAVEEYKEQLKIRQRAGEQTINIQYTVDLGRNNIININDLWLQFKGNDPGVILSYIITDKEVFVACLFSNSKKFDFFRFRDYDEPELTIRNLKNAALGLKRILNQDLKVIKSHLIPEMTKLTDGLNNNQILYDQDNVFYKKNRTGLSANAQIFVYITELYNFLFQKIHRKLIDNNIGRIYIIRDNEIHYLPFELLVNRREVYCYNLDNFGVHQLKYLIKYFKISYHLSISLLFKKHKNKTDLIHLSHLKARKPLLSIVSNYKDYAGQFTFVNSEEFLLRNPVFTEILKSISPKLFHLLNNEKITFKSLCTQLKNTDFSIIYIHMHTNNRNDSNVDFGLVFPSSPTNLKVFTPENIQLLNMNHVKFLLLVACRGGERASASTYEIPNSLANAFIAAGVHNMLYSSFRAGSLEEGLIIQPFLANLRAGMNYGTALQQAKIMLINSEHSDFNEPRRIAHPQYWAKFTFIGNQLGGIL